MPPKYVNDIVKLFRERPKPRFIKPDPMPPPRQITGLGSVLEEVWKIQLPPTGDPPLELNEARIRRRQQKIIANQKKLDAFIENYHPKENPVATGNPFNTLFLGNIPSDVDESQLRYEFSPFGKIKSLNFVYDKITGERRPYCFLEYENQDSYRSALSQGTNLYINNTKIIVDGEKARTIEGWLPRRLGGGEGAVTRRFSKKRIVMENFIPKRRRKPFEKFGRRYKGHLREFSRKRDEKLGIVRDKRGRGPRKFVPREN